MNALEFDHFDLNLLRAYRAVLLTGSVSEAADRLGTSQSAVSHALRRLREICGDAMFVRTPSGMEPTPFAQEIAEPIQLALEQIRNVLESHDRFDPSTTQRTFTVALSDAGQLTYLPTLVSHLNRSAPGAKLVVHAVTSHRLKELMQEGRVDLSIGLLPALQGGFHQKYLYNDGYVCVARADHPRISGSLTLEQFRAEGHVMATRASTAPNHVEELLSEQKIVRPVVVQVPNFLSVAPMVGATDLLAVLPRRIARLPIPGLAVQILELPFTLPVFDIYQFWHERLHKDGAHRWFRGVIAGLLGEATE